MVGPNSATNGASYSGIVISWIVGLAILSTLLTACVASTLLESVTATPTSPQGQTSPTAITEGCTIVPAVAWLIRTRGGGLGIEEQILLEDATDKVVANDGILVTLEGSRQQFDVIDREELYVFFPAERLQEGIAGFLVVSLRLEDEGTATFDAICLERESSKHYSLVVWGDSRIEVKPWMHYALTPTLKKVGSAEEGELGRAKTLLGVLSFRNEFVPDFLVGQRDQTRVPLNPLFLSEIRSLALASSFMDGLDTKFGIESDLANIWDAGVVNIEEIKSTAQQVLDRYEWQADLYVLFKCPALGISYGDESLRYDVEKEYVVVRNSEHFPALLAIRVIPRN